MKNRSTIFLIAIACFCFGGVTFPTDTGKYKVPKTECYVTDAVTVMSHSLSYEPQPLVGFHNYDATEVTPVFVLKGSIAYLKPDKPVYKDPDVDRKWVWCYSHLHNI